MNDFDLFVRNHTGELLRTAYLIVWDQQEAEDAVQEMLITLARHWRRVQNMEYPLAYARQILVNQALRAKRRNKRHAELPARLSGQPTLGQGLSQHQRQLDPNGSLHPFEPAGQRDLPLATAEHLDLLKALATLPRDQRAVVTLRYFNDYSEEQIAELLGCKPGTVKSRCARALDQLRGQLAPPSTAAPTPPARPAYIDAEVKR